MKDRIVRFLSDLDAALVPVAESERLPLYHLGRSALIWKYGFSSATKDVDFIQPSEESSLAARALQLFGNGTAKAIEHGLYLEFVPSALPPVAAGYKKRAQEFDGGWRAIQLFELEAHDLAVTKLRRFAAKDRQDLIDMCDSELLDPEELGRRFESAMWPYIGVRFREDAEVNLRTIQKYILTGQ